MLHVACVVVCRLEGGVGMSAQETGNRARLPSTPYECDACLLVYLYRRVSTRERFGVWSPDGRSTPSPPSMIADPLGGSAKPVRL